MRLDILKDDFDYNTSFMYSRLVIIRLLYIITAFICAAVVVAQKLIILQSITGDKPLAYSYDNYHIEADVLNNTIDIRSIAHCYKNIPVYFHNHTRYSFDSMTQLEEYAGVLNKKHEKSALIITDHDTFMQWVMTQKNKR